MIPLETLTPCFQGLVPAWFFTCSRDGVPNASIVSHVDFVDGRHVALSFQFFNKSRRNIAENPHAIVRVYDPDSMTAYRLQLRFVRSETAGPTFETMRLRIEAIASYSGLKGIFKLLAADIYEVLDISPTLDELAPSARTGPPFEPPLPFTMDALAELSERLQRASCLDAVLDAVLDTLTRAFGFSHTMILLAMESPDRLVTLASRGYPAGGVGSEVRLGEGIVGVVAEARKPLRVSGMLQQMLYAHAVQQRATELGLRPERYATIPLPGLERPQSQLGIPLIARDELVGVLCVESEHPYRFHEEDKRYLEVLGGFVAIAIRNAQLSEVTDDPQPARAHPPTAPHARPIPLGEETPAPLARPRRKVAYYAADEVILVDDDYLVRGLPAKVLWKILNEHDAGRTEFTNRLLRLDKSLGLPELKDNLESRLILLRKRLEERCPDIRLVPTGRGRFTLDLRCDLTLLTQP